MLQLMLLPYRTPVAKLQQESVNFLQTTMKVLVLCAILYGAGIANVWSYHIRTNKDTKEQWYKILDFDPISGCKGGGLVGALKCAMFKVAVNICRASALGIKRTAEEKACEYMDATAAGTKRTVYCEAHNNAADAYRHALAMFLLSWKCDEDVVKEVGDAHERGDDNPTDEGVMDLYNNKVGRDLYKKYKDKYGADGPDAAEAANIIKENMDLLMTSLPKID